MMRLPPTTQFRGAVLTGARRNTRQRILNPHCGLNYGIFSRRARPCPRGYVQAHRFTQEFAATALLFRSDAVDLL